MRLGLFLALVASATALQCNVGNLIVQNGIITTKALEQNFCDGMCTRTSVDMADRTVVFMGCEENEITNFLKKSEKKTSCSASSLEYECSCAEDLCNEFKAEENIQETAVEGEAPLLNGPKCYVGYFASNGTVAVNTGDTVYCGSQSACASVNSTVYGFDVEAYFCVPAVACDTLFGTTGGSGCGTVAGDQGTVSGCCCKTGDCSGLPTGNPQIVVPTSVTSDKQNVTCWNGVQLNYNSLGGMFKQPCSGSCGSISIKTTYMGKPMLLDLFTCDPVELCSAVNLNNQCGNIALSGSNSLLRGCCCNSNTCIDPTTVPPTYPVKTLKCYTGLYVPSNNYSIGAEMYCQGQCGRIEIPIGGQMVKYMMCAPYATCQGMGIAQADQCYNPPLEEETKVCCCSSADNCNIAANDTNAISPNVTFVPTVNYPVLCYSGIVLNGNPITTASYAMCNGECASASFVSRLYNQTHNTTIYTCDPVSMCKSAGLSNSCGAISGVTGVNACCCDSDRCFDPIRKPFPNMTCFTGVYIKEDNYLVGGEMMCDGWCASLSTMVNNKTSTSYWCAPVYTCRRLGLGMGGNNNCASISGTSNTLTGCCCSDSSNCNLPPALLPNVTSIAPRYDPPIVCYEAIRINNQLMGNDRYRVCNGECVSMRMGDKLANGSIVTTDLYTCDSSSTCAAMGLRNGCGSVDGTVQTCCCDSDACIDPTVNRSPGTQRKCYVGVQTSYMGGISVGAELVCGGKCANLTSTVNGVPFNSYHCMPTTVCRGLGLDNSCNAIQLDRAVQGCCCDNADSCNVGGNLSINTTIPVSPPEAPIACYSGVSVNGVFTAGSGWQTCQGDCMSVSINTTYMSANYLATIYTCDPTSVCSALNITNRCHPMEPGVEGCCCSTSGCIDPTKNPIKKPGRPLTCWVGLWSQANNLTVGREAQCVGGACATLNSRVGNSNTTVFACVQPSMCSALGTYNDCRTIQTDRAITACCCDNTNNCNGNGYNIGTNITIHQPHIFPVLCYNGIYINNQPIGQGNWASCMGDCASVSIQTTLNNASYQADLYTCDPVTVCHQLGLTNNCSTVEPGLSGCCCATDQCIDPTVTPVKKPGIPLKCYVGIKSYMGMTTGVDVGSEVLCSGKCGYLHGLIGSYNVTAYTCTPSAICSQLGLNDRQRRLPGDRQLTAQCCDNYSNCNVYDSSINTKKPIPTNQEYPISCYQGIFVNGTAITSAGFQTCNGDCVSLSMNTTYFNTTVTAQLYTCDPSAVCRQLGVVNNCSTIEPGLQGCCCSSNGCLDPTKNPAKTPGNPLQCYVGVQSTYNNLSVGAAMTCPGKCASLSGIVGNQSVTTYHCVSYGICSTLALNDNCVTLPGDRQLTGCCCDNSNFCTTKNTTINTGAVPKNVEYPISCWNGLYVNGKPITSTSWQVCNGDCASVTINTTLNNGTSVSASLYTCDPSSVCTQLNTMNTCSNLEPGVRACCCNSDACIDPSKGKDPSNPLMCYVGVKSTYNNLLAGASLPCSGKCSSLSGIVANQSVTTFQCIDPVVCSSLQLNNACQTLPGDRQITACCCDNQPYCNVNNTGIAIPTPPTYTEAPIVCYNGVYLNGNPVTTGRYSSCQGKCASVTVNTTMGTGNASTTYSASIYTCDPSTVCDQLGLSNACATVEPGVGGCCCDSNACLDPTKGKTSLQSLTCYVGLYAAYNNYSIGSDVYCDGQCVSLQTTVNGSMVKAYQCVTNQICENLGISNSCSTIKTDRDITGCCCNNQNNCNVGNEIVAQNLPPVANWTGRPIVCYSGIYLNGNPIGKAGYNVCKGDCAAIQINTTIASTSNSAVLYTCDPITVCKSLNLNNNCGSLDKLPGMTGCCCNVDGCFDGTSIYPKNIPQSTSSISFLLAAFTAVYMMLRQ